MNIYIANLSYGVNDANLWDLFNEYGEVSSAKIIMDRETGRSRGFGFVEMPNDEEGEKAIEALNNAEYDGKTIAVSVARPREERPAYGGGGGNRCPGGGDGGYNKRRY
ncbi:MAG: RNA-binding protein [Bacteroides sp.]|nr:RNA-binding protein [Bacteroides sp.]